MKSPLVERYRALTARLPGVLADLEAEIAPGRTTRELEMAAQDAVERRGYESCFKGYRCYPAFITASINEEVLNTPPDDRRLKEGDLLKVQVGIKGGGASAYQSWSYAVGSVSEVDRRLIDAARQGLAGGVEAARTSVAAISRAIEAPILKAGFTVNSDYVGHGMGEGQHELPQIPCAVIPGYDARLVPGQILSIQSIAHVGVQKSRTVNWNVRTADGKRAVLFSQMVVVADGPAEVLLVPRDPYVACGR